MISKVKFTSDTAKNTQIKINDNFDELDSRTETLEAKTHTSDFTNDGSGTEYEEYSGYTSFSSTSDYVGYYVLVDTTYTKVTNSNKDSLSITAGTTAAYTYSPYATHAYVAKNGGKIDSISVNNVAQTIDANKNVNITVPTSDSDLTNNRYVRYDTNTQGLSSTNQGNARTNIDAQQTISSSNKLSADLIADGTTNKAYTATEQTKLSGIASGAQVNVLESVKSGTTTFSISSKAVDIQGVDNLTNYYTKTDTYTKSEVDGMVSSVYKPAGSVAFASLPTLASGVLGNVYSVTDSFTIDNRFVEYSSGSTKTYPAGTNVVVVNTGTSESPTYMFDVLAGFVDLSGYVPTSRKVNNKALSSDITLSASDVGAEPTISTKNTAFNKNFETSTSNIKMNGSVSVGSADTVARADHIHPSDTSKQDVIDSSHKLSSDLVDDASHTNQFIKEISDQEIRITSLTAGIYRLSYNGAKKIYYNGSTSTDYVDLNNILVGTEYPEILLHVDNTFATGYTCWYFIGSGTNASAQLVYGRTNASAGDYTVAPFAEYLRNISSYVKDNLTYSTSGTMYALSAYQGYLLNQNKQDKYTTYSFTASDNGWSSVDSDGFYTLTITSTKKPFICYNSSGEQVMAGLKTDGSNIYVVTDTKFAGSVLAF